MTEAEKALSQQLFGGQQQSVGALEAVKEAFLTVAPGLKDIGAEVKAELAYQAGAGAHELAAALFNGSAFVMYPRGSKEDQSNQGPEPSHEQAQDGQGMQHDAPGQHVERGGRSM
jgi:hypothetical protein